MSRLLIHFLPPAPALVKKIKCSLRVCREPAWEKSTVCLSRFLVPNFAGSSSMKFYGSWRDTYAQLRRREGFQWGGNFIPPHHLLQVSLRHASSSGLLIWSYNFRNVEAKSKVSWNTWGLSIRSILYRSLKIYAYLFIYPLVYVAFQQLPLLPW